MTHIKSKLITSAIIMAFAATPAFADHHAGDAMKAGDHMMKKGDDAMKKGGDMMTSTAAAMTAEQRMKAEAKIMGSMSVEDKAAYMALSPKAQKMMMDKKLSGGDYMPGTDTMMTDTVISNSQGTIVMDAQESGSMMQSTTAATMPMQTMAPVACPAGSTAQPDGTCMMTGDGDLMFDTGTSMSSSTSMSTDSMSTSTMMDSRVSTTGRYTTEGKPYMGTLDPATAFGDR